VGWGGGGGGVGWGGAGLARVEGVALTASLSSRPSSRPSPRPTPTPAPRRTAQLAGGAFIASMEDVEIGPGDIIDVEVTEVNELKRQVRVQVYLVG
jgi:protein involved in polysaccharide export with SLBB domain